MKIYLLSDNVDTLLGMRLSGIDGKVIHEKEELIKGIEEALKIEGLGILLITELLTTKYSDIVNNVKLTVKKPLILSIPDRHGTVRRADFITAYINDAIGIKL